MKIYKSSGTTRTEKLLSELCDGTFLKLWSYPNPFRQPGKELCDLIAVFENHVFLFFDRESRAFDLNTGDTDLAWQRWKKEAIDKQIKSARKARSHVLLHPKQVYLDAKCTLPLPIRITSDNLILHTIVVAHGASKACKNSSPNNVTGSLAVSYSDKADSLSIPFMLDLNRSEPVHILDSYNLEIILKELDTFYDFTSYISAKEEAIAKFNFMYSGEEDLLAHYYHNFDEVKGTHFIGAKGEELVLLLIPEGEWQVFINSGPYLRKKKADEVSYLWDRLLQRTGQNAIDGTLIGDGGIYDSESAIFEMAKEPRFSRRALSEHMIASINNFPEGEKLARNLSFMPSFFPLTAYVFLQVHHPEITDYDNDYRPKRRAMLEIACGAARNKFNQYTKIIGIAIDAPKYNQRNSEDFILLKCGKWSESDRQYYLQANEGFNFFSSSSAKTQIKRISNFPENPKTLKPIKIGRNALCPCGSGKKYKRCHGSP